MADKAPLETHYSPLNLYQKMLLITEAVGKIEKTGTNTAQNYKFIEQAAVVAEIRVRLKEFGVVIIPETLDRTMERYVQMKPGYKANDPMKEQSTFHANVKSRYTIINADNPEERIICEWDAGEALDTSDKATNKATTASHKSFLMKTFFISDKEDPDLHSPEAPITPVYNPNDFPPEPVHDIQDSEGITPEAITQLEGQVKLKGITNKAAIDAVLNNFAKIKGGETIKDVSLAQSREIYAAIRATAAADLTMLTDGGE
jgi:hypothetical protein